MTAATCSIPEWGWSISEQKLPDNPASSFADEGATTISTTDDSLDGVKMATLESEALRELENYLELPKGWDGYGGDEFEPETVMRAGFLARWVGQYFRSNGAVPDAMTPGPAGDGSVDLEITLGDAYLLFTVSPEDAGSVEVCFGGAGAEDTEERCPFKQSAVDAWLERLVSSTIGAPAMAAA